MANDIEKLKCIIDLATDKGKMEQQNSHLTDEIERLAEESKGKDSVIAKQAATIDQMAARIRELEAIICNSSQVTMGAAQLEAGNASPQVVVNQYILLSAPKTVDYVRALDDSHRMFAGHMLINTVANNSQRQIDSITEMTRLEGHSMQERLADAMEEVAKKPTTQNIYGDKNDFNEDAKMLKLTLPADADPAEIAMRIAEQQKQIEKKNKK